MGRAAGGRGESIATKRLKWCGESDGTKQETGGRKGILISIEMFARGGDSGGIIGRQEGREGEVSNHFLSE